MLLAQAQEDLLSWSLSTLSTSVSTQPVSKLFLRSFSPLRRQTLPGESQPFLSPQSRVEQLRDVRPPGNYISLSCTVRKLSGVILLLFSKCLPTAESKYFVRAKDMPAFFASKHSLLPNLRRTPIRSPKHPDKDFTPRQLPSLFPSLWPSL